MTHHGQGRLGLKVYNSLTRSLEHFTPNDPNGHRVTWYSCGPTVYDASHMGHARSYISFDILRRVFSEYFGYDVFYVMNVTDIDDKIIKRARQEHLLGDYAKKTELRHMISDTAEAVDAYVQETVKTVDPEKRTMREKILHTVKAFMHDLENDIQANPSQDKEHREGICAGAKDILYEWLDKKYMEEEKKAVLDNEIFASFARRWEDDYFSDMSALNIKVPDVLTRVSEYVPEIVEFIVQIIKNGYAYESNGSVYFDVQTYRVSGSHKYAKLVPEAVGDAQALQEGEGELSNAAQGEKKSSADFALWKASRVGEPSWDSPWGKGRPGWHIECSAMASAIIGKELDIHTGGVDLKFPHHDNEIAQSEAFFENDNWVKYFMHSGHLTISGCKMSKSLKNFVSIKDALKEYTSAQLRMTFLLHSWKDTLDYSPCGMLTAVQMEKTISEFFLNVKDCLRSSGAFPKWTVEDMKFNYAISSAKKSVHKALCDNIDTRSAMFALKDLIGNANVYIQSRKNERLPINGPLLKSAAVYITSILRTFGVIHSQETDSFGFQSVGQEGSRAGVNEEDIVLPYVEVLSDFREKIRITARSIENPAIKSSILKECDLIRDEKLPNLGVRMEDHEGSPTVLKYVGREAMLKEREARAKLEEECRLQKEAKRLEQLKAQEEKEAQKRIPPSEIFRREGEGKYSQYDEKGIPTHDAEGTPIPKTGLKKLQKIYATQEKKYNEYLSSEGKQGNHVPSPAV